MSDAQEHVYDEILKDPKIRAVVADARLFDGLRTNEAWIRLYAMVNAKRERWMTQISLRLMGPQKNWPRPEEIAHHQGFYQGAMFVLEHPAHAEQSLERAATIAWAMLQDQSEEDE